MREAQPERPFKRDGENRQFYNALKRPIAVVNLDPACPEPPYKADVSLTSLITLDDVMQEFGLGPNGGMLYCLEYLEANFDWLVEELAKVKADYVVFDLPGQVELSTDHLVRLSLDFLRIF